jgi:hypothetical protein
MSAHHLGCPFRGDTKERDGWPLAAVRLECPRRFLSDAHGLLKRSGALRELKTPRNSRPETHRIDETGDNPAKATPAPPPVQRQAQTPKRKPGLQCSSQEPANHRPKGPLMARPDRQTRPAAEGTSDRPATLIPSIVWVLSLNWFLRNGASPERPSLAYS